MNFGETISSSPSSFLTYNVRNECDPKGEGFLDLDSFVKGMWRIDEELRRTQTHALKSTSNVSLSSLKSRLSQANPRTQKPKDILR